MPQLSTGAGICWQTPSGGKVVEQRAYCRMDTGVDKRAGTLMAGQTKALRLEWCCLIPVATLWLVVQEEAPLYPSVDLAEVRVRLLLVAGLCLLVGLGVLALRYNNPTAQLQEHQEEVLSSTHSNMVMARQNAMNTQTCMPGGGAVGLPGPAVQALMDCLVLSLLQEPELTLSPFSVLPLVSKLEALSKALQRADALWDPPLPERQGQEENKDDVIKERIKDINTYLKERLEALHCLQQLQTEFEACVQDTHGQLQKYWTQLEELHVSVTISPTHTDSLPESSQALTDTQRLFSELDNSKSSVQQCQTSQAANSKILKKLDHSWLELSKTVNTELLCPSWTSDLLQSNNDKVNDVLQNSTSLEQQTSTFVVHLKGLEKAVSLDKKQITRSSSLPANRSVQDTTHQSAFEKSIKTLFRVKSTGFRGLRRKRK
ncbi:uncharacterized protein si:ch211-151h10.2 isoform X2 [Alosa sapidissima]|uniref:uncharacterized protein si:ch211-151h10.2 isoform X2 n=1 Tax=Alosa sapidissima TaxID=34773 RepID=UPI001C08C980|nr:uncharacterized protein si:ch211-151h10.2 isoform X2 [Alosa sapidissima]